MAPVGDARVEWRERGVLARRAESQGQEEGRLQHAAVADHHHRLVRVLAHDPSQRGAVVEEWHAIQACVPGLYGNLADSICQQLECHQRWAWALRPDGEWATGPTYDLESWRPKLEDDNFFAKSASKCGGYLGVEPDGEFSNPYRPDAGVTDLEHAFDNYG